MEPDSRKIQLDYCMYDLLGMVYIFGRLHRIHLEQCIEHSNFEFQEIPGDNTLLLYNHPNLDLEMGRFFQLLREPGEQGVLRLSAWMEDLPLSFFEFIYKDNFYLQLLQILKEYAGNMSCVIDKLAQLQALYNKMFRQKIAEVTNCSCRLIPNDKNQFGVFKVQNPSQKVYNKDLKQKYSLKNQANSSNKHDNKVTSAQKTIITQSIQHQDQKISISGNIDSRKRKPSDKQTISSPYQNQIDKIQQSLMNSKIDEKQNTYRNLPLIKTTEANRTKIQKQANYNSNNQGNIMNPRLNKIKVSNFGNQPSQCIRSNKSQNNLKTLNSFEDYYKFVANPYNQQKNKQNLKCQTNKHPPLKKRPKNSKNDNLDCLAHAQFNNKQDQMIINMRPHQFDNQTHVAGQQNHSRPLQEINRNIHPQIFHESLQKTVNYDRSKQIRATHNGFSKSKSPLCEYLIQQKPKLADSVNKERTRENKKDPNQLHLNQNSSTVNFKAIQPNQNQNLQNIFQQKLVHSKKIDFAHQFQANKNERAQVSQDYYLLNNRAPQNHGNNDFSQNSHLEKSKMYEIKLYDFMQQSSISLVKQNKSYVNQHNRQFSQTIDQINDNKKNQSELASTCMRIPEPEPIYSVIDQSRKIRTTQNSQIRLFQQQPNLNQCSIDQNIQYSQVFNTKSNKAKVLMEKMISFNEIMSTRQECQSVIGEGQNQNQQSVVIMRYKDLFETNTQNQTESKKSVCEGKHYDLLLSDRNNFILKQLNISNIMQDKNKSVYTASSKESNFFTNVKQYGKRDHLNGLTNTSHLVDNNLKKTVKVSKQYLTHNFVV